MTVKYFDISIFQRLTGFISRNLTVPCENSEDTMPPAITIASSATTVTREVLVRNTVQNVICSGSSVSNSVIWFAVLSSLSLSS